jgi:hypothetical protein
MTDHCNENSVLDVRLCLHVYCSLISNLLQHMIMLRVLVIQN